MITNRNRGNVTEITRMVSEYIRKVKRAAHAQWRVAGEQVFAGTSPGPAGSYGAHQVGLVRNSKVDHHRYTIVVLTITMMIS